MLVSAGAVGVSLVLDGILAELPTAVHPVAWFGRLVAPLDREWTAPRLVGALGTLALSLGAATAVGGLVWLAARVQPLLGVAVAGLVLFVTTSLRMLLAEAAAVSVASERDVETARDRLRALAGRDTAGLSPGQLRSAAVESLAENLADGLVAPLLAFALGAVVWLPLGAAVATWVKAVNTMDSMLGYESKPVGWAPARLDDLVMWIPARASALLLALAGRAPGALGDARGWTAAVPSPNSGWPMGVLAAVLSVRLEKPGSYVLNPTADLPTVTDARRGVRTVAVAGLGAYVLAALAITLPEVIP